MRQHDWWVEGPPLEILLLEDNPSDTDAFRRALGHCERDTRLVALVDGEEATDYLMRKGKYEDASLPDIIVTSIVMPKARGFQVLQWIKLQPALRCIPVLFLTTSEREEDILRAYDGGAAGFFTKPVKEGDYIPIAKAIADYWSKAWTPVGCY
jgi:chemotaxis family two-component system response regulator Rcp1